jgi:hypothetical protein
LRKAEFKKKPRRWRLMWSTELLMRKSSRRHRVLEKNVSGSDTYLVYELHSLLRWKLALTSKYPGKKPQLVAKWNQVKSQDTIISVIPWTQEEEDKLQRLKKTKEITIKYTSLGRCNTSLLNQLLANMWNMKQEDFSKVKEEIAAIDQQNT